MCRLPDDRPDVSIRDLSGSPTCVEEEARAGPGSIRRSPAQRQFARFLGVGSANTLVTTALFYLLSHWLPATAAFTIVYLAGLAFVALVTPRFVFGVRAGIPDRLLLIAWYLIVYVIGLLSVRLLGDIISAPRELVVIGTVAVTAPLAFAGSRLLLGHPRRPRPGNHV